MNNERLLSIYPNTRGFGYACLESPNTLLDSGIAGSSPNNNQALIKRIQRLIALYKPTKIIVRNPYTAEPIRPIKAQILFSAVALLAKELNLPLYEYTRGQMREVLEQFGAYTKHEIAKQIVQEFPELSPRMPMVRKPWLPEDYDMGLFDAMALVVTHKYLRE